MSEMPIAESVNKEDLIPIVQGGINKVARAKDIGTGEGGITGDTLPIGAVIEYPSDKVPENWLLCDGRAISRTEYYELFAAIGTTWGEGDGSTTFNLPTKAGLVTAGVDASDGNLNKIGKTYGEKTHKLIESELPKLTGSMAIAYLKAFMENPSGIVKRRGSSTTVYEVSTSNSGPNNNASIGFNIEFGNGETHNNMQPTVASNFIIKAKQSVGLVATVVDNLNSDSEIDALSAKQGKILAQNMIIESVNNGVSGYRKYADGTLEQWGEKTFSGVNISNEYYGTCKRGPEGQALGTFQVPFISKPNLQLNAQRAGVWMVQQSWGNNTTNLPNITFVAPNDYNSTVSVTVSWFAIGKWK